MITNIALAIAWVGAIVTANIYFSLWEWLINDSQTRSDIVDGNSPQAQKKDPG